MIFIMMKMLHNHFCISVVVSLCICAVLFGACDNDKVAFKDKIALLQSNALYLPLDSMNCVAANNGDSVIRKNDFVGMKLVVYTDTAACSSCVLNKMYKWNGLLKKLEVYGDLFQVYFIFRPLPKDIDSFYMAIRRFSSSYPIYLESLGMFERVNPQIPSDVYMHTFLLDNENNVLLVGNPIWNEKIEALFWRTVEERLGKPKDEKSE